MEKLTIGEMAKLNHISEQTLRLYDKMGLLQPYLTDTKNKYRYYNIKQSARLDMIQHMKSLGMSLKSIKEQLDQTDFSLIKSILTRKSDSIDTQIKELNYQKRAIQRTIESYDRYANSPPDGTILVEYISKRFIYSVDVGINFYDYDIEVYEKILREFKKNLITNNLPQIYFCNAGTILRQDNFKNRKFISTEVFVFVDNEDIAENLIYTLPSNTYLCIYCNKFDKEKEYATRLLDTAMERGYTIVGDYICEVLTDLPIFESNERGMFLRLQVPIKFC
ncbi:hypothetical protein SRRS_41640 [Sporomusa rhizae]|uniref:MerR family transcriptional regulator n=1 Tax=Sporomusa rhizae TaxID=357999 RepID=UPI00352ABCE4